MMISAHIKCKLHTNVLDIPIHLISSWNKNVSIHSAHVRCVYPVFNSKKDQHFDSA